jgi:hypothetical protein
LNLKGVTSKSNTYKLDLPLNINIEYYFRYNNNQLLINSYFLKIQKRYLNIDGENKQTQLTNSYPIQLKGNTYEIPNSEKYLYILIPYTTIKTTIAIWITYFILASAALLLAIFLTIRFLQNCDKGQFFIPANARYLRIISYIAIGFSIFDYIIQWVIFSGLNNHFDDIASLKLTSVVEFNWTYLIISLFLVVIAQAFTEGIKLKEEQNLTI